MLDSPADNERKSKGNVSDKGADRLETSERVPPSKTSKLNVLARGYCNASGKDKTKGAPQDLDPVRFVYQTQKYILYQCKSAF